MQTDPDATRIVRSWLDQGATMLPDRVLDTVLDQIPATPQRRSWWPARRSNEMNTPLKVAISAAVVAVVVMAGIAFTVLPGAGGVGGSPAVLPPTAVPTPMPTPAPTPGSSPIAGPTAVTPTPSPLAVDNGWPGRRESPAGRYSWSPSGVGVSTWMHKLPSHLGMEMEMSGNAFRPGLMGVTVGGYDATYQMLPAKKSKEIRERHVWIVDIDGTPLTIVLNVGVEASAADLAEGMAIVASIDIERTTSKLGFKIAFDLQAGWDSA